MPTLCLRISRFFAQTPELQALYRLYRGVDVRDAAAAHVLAVTNQEDAFDIMNISARSPYMLIFFQTLSIKGQQGKSLRDNHCRGKTSFSTRLDR